MGALDGFYSTWNKARETFGQGVPTDGSQFDRSSELLNMKASVEAAAPDDRWQGSGASAYAAANKEHAQVYEKLADLDRKMAAEVKNAANVVNAGRSNLDNVKGWVDGMVKSLPATSEQDRERKLIPIAREGISRVNNIVNSATDDMRTIQGRVNGFKGEYDHLKNTIRFGPDGSEPAEKRDGKPKDPKLNSENGRSDGEAIKNGAGRVMLPDYRDRLLEAGTLTEQELADLAAGKDVAVGADRMAYLYQLSQSLNGMSPDEIKALQASLPEDERKALAQGLLIVSNPHALSGIPNDEGVTDETRDTFIPAAGSLVNLPDQLHQELSRTDRIEAAMATPSVGQKIFDSTIGVVLGGDPNAHDVESVRMNGVAGLQDAKDIFAPAGTGYVNGSEATKAMLAAASEYANADIDNPHATSDARGPLKGALADVVQYAGANDHVSMRDLTTSDGGDQFLRGLTQEHWGPDDSHKVGDAFRWVDNDPSNPVNGTTASHLAHYLAEHKPALQNLPNGGGTFGDTNPGVATGIAEALSPYVGQLAGLEGADNGIETFHHSGEGSSVGMSDLYSVLDQNHESAGIINAATSNTYEKILTETAQNGFQSYDLEVGGRLLDAMQLGAEDADLFSHETAQWEQAVKEGAEKDQIDQWKDIVSLLPHGSTGWALTQAGLGMDPGLPQNPATIPGGTIMRDLIMSGGPAENTAMYRGAILEGLIEKHPDIARDPSLAPLVTGDQVDPTKFTNNNDAARIIANWFDSNAAQYGVDESSWKTSIDNGRSNDNWG